MRGAAAVAVVAVVVGEAAGVARVEDVEEVAVVVGIGRAPLVVGEEGGATRGVERHCCRVVLWWCFLVGLWLVSLGWVGESGYAFPRFGCVH